MRLRYDRESRSLQFSVNPANIGKFLLVKLIELNVIVWGGLALGGIVIFDDLGWLTYGFILLLLLTYYPLKKLLRKYRRINLVELYLVILGSFFLGAVIEGQIDQRELASLSSDERRVAAFALAWILVAAYYPFKKLLEFTWRRRQHFKRKRIALIGSSVLFLLLGIIPVLVILDPVGFRNNADIVMEECGTPPLTPKRVDFEEFQEIYLDNQETSSADEYWIFYDADNQAIAGLRRYHIQGEGGASLGLIDTECRNVYGILPYHGS